MSKSKYVKGFVFLALAFAAAGCTVVTPEAGQEAVVVDKPWFFGRGGVQPEPIPTGLQYTWLSSRPVYVNIYPVQYDSNFKDMMSADGVPLQFHSSIRLQVVDSVSLVKNFGAKWYQNNIEQEFENRVRTAAKKHGMNETAIYVSAIEAIDEELTRGMTEYINEKKLPVKLIKVTVGRVNPPDSILDQRTETAKQQQRSITEQQRALAEIQRADAEKKRALADNAYKDQIGLNNAQFLELERINMQREVCTKNKSCTVFMGDTPTPFMNVR